MMHYIEAVDEVSEYELPVDDLYIPVSEARKDLISTAESYTYLRDKSIALKALK